MSSPGLESFPVCRAIPANIGLTVASLHVFDDIYGQNALLITDDDCVYGLGVNTYGSLGLGHTRPVPEVTLIPELCQKNIQQFTNGFNFVLALTGTGGPGVTPHEHWVYSWGCNSDGQLGRGGEPPPDYNRCLKPALIGALQHKSVAQIACGYYHALALTSDGQVYGWGDNLRCQVGVYEHLNTISTPIRVRFVGDPPIGSVRAHYYHSFAVTPVAVPADGNGGRVFTWGNNYCGQLGHQTTDIYPARPVPGLADIVTVCPDAERTWFLARDGSVYLCGKYRVKSRGYFSAKMPPIAQKLPKLSALVRPNGYHKPVPYVLGRALSTGKVVIITDSLETIDTNYTSFEVFYANECQLTFNTIRVNQSVISQCL